jgi:hypothetical protein
MSNEKQASYFEQRMEILGITAATNKVGIWRTDLNSPGQNKLEDVPVFTESEKGIDILVYTLDRNIVNYKPENSRWSKSYCLTRLKEPIVRKDGGVQKYYIPKGQGTHPFFHPALIDKFEKKVPIDTLFLTEGYFKSWKGCMHGLDIVGLSSITHMKEKESGKLHSDIRRLRDHCNVKRMIWLTDGDCLDITGKELKDGVDLYKRPKNFFNSCENFRSVLDDWDGDKWFYHIDTDNIVSASEFEPAPGLAKSREGVKGLDDLLITFGHRTDDIVADAKTVVGNNSFFVKHNITLSTRKIYSYFRLSNVNEFYLFHSERRPEMKNVDFVFNGTRYHYDDTQNECKIITPGAAKQYFRVGDTYYKFIEKVNEEGHIEKGFEKRLKTTIIDDHGKKFCDHIPKYEAFCNKPSHTDYQQVIHNNFNVYFPFEHEPAADECREEDFPAIMSFFKHIFGEKEIEVKQKNGPPIKTSYYQLGLDLVQIMFQKPTVRLPILCLVSRENETGKSTFGNLMKAIFTNNASTVGNSDLADDFNSFWATKLLIMCDETKIDKQAVVEKVKSLTFAKKIGLNAKGKDKIEIPFFGKFMFFTNNEENFIYASEEDLRYWVIKVPRIREKNPDFEQTMYDEIPNFLSFLNHRKIVAPRMTRMWFDPELLKTEALKKVIAHSQSSVKKELIYFIGKMFRDFGVEKILMSCQAIKENFFKNKEEAYVDRVLKDEMKMIPKQWYVYKGQKYESEGEAMSVAQSEGLNELEALNAISRKGRGMRYRYPRWDTKTNFESRAVEKIMVMVSENGRPYEFLRSEFVPADEEIEVPDDIREAATFDPEDRSPRAAPQATGTLMFGATTSPEPIDDLPF